MNPSEVEAIILVLFVVVFGIGYVVGFIDGWISRGLAELAHRFYRWIRGRSA